MIFGERQKNFHMFAHPSDCFFPDVASLAAETVFKAGDFGLRVFGREDNDRAIVMQINITHRDDLALIASVATDCHSCVSV